MPDRVRAIRLLMHPASETRESRELHRMNRGVGGSSGPLTDPSAAYPPLRNLTASLGAPNASPQRASIVQFQPKDDIYRQGDVADAVFLLQAGSVKLSASSQDGKEGVLGLLSSGSFLGEGCLRGQSRRVNTATVLTISTVVRVPRETMAGALRADAALAATFMWHLLDRQSRIEEDLLDHLFNGSEKRLARTLLLLAGIADPLVRDVELPHLTQETLAEIVGTTRSRVSFFMNRFRLRGFVDYDRANTLTVRHSLLTVVHDDPRTRR